MTTPNPEGNAFVQVWRNPYVRAVVFVLLLYAAYRLLDVVSHVLTLAAIAYIIAYLANPLLNWLQRRRVRRGVGILLVVLMIFGFLVLASTLIIAVAAQLADLLRVLPELVTSVTTWANGLLDRFGDRPYVDVIREQINTIAQSSAQTLTASILPFIQRLLAYDGVLFGGILSVASTLAEAVAVLILSIYMMADFDKIGLTLLRAFPRNWQPTALELSGSVGEAVGGYLRGQLIIAAAVGLMVWLGLALAGIPSALAIGFLAGAFNIVPYLGPIIAIIPAVLLAIPLGWLKVVLVVVVIVVANQIEGNFLSPIVLGRTTNLHPVTVVLAILTGVVVAGIVGALVAVPLAALGKLLLMQYYYPSRVYREGP